MTTSPSTPNIKPKDHSVSLQKFPVYKFIGEGELQPDGKREYAKLEVCLRANIRPFLVTVGSSVFLNSGEPIPPPHIQSSKVDADIVSSREDGKFVSPKWNISSSHVKRCLSETDARFVYYHIANLQIFKWILFRRS